MDADGVDASVVMGMGWTDHGLAREVNDYIVESVRRYPGRLYGFCRRQPGLGRTRRRARPSGARPPGWWAWANCTPTLRATT